MLKKILLIALLAVTRAEGNDACQADFDGNGIVDFADFLLFNGLYGQRGGEQCAMTVDADSLAVVTTLRDSISALQAALGATRFAVATLQTTTTELQNALASETERANENQRLLTASNDAFNSLAQTRCPENEPAAQPEPPVPAPQPEPEPPVVIEPPLEPEPDPLPVPRFVTLAEGGHTVSHPGVSLSVVKNIRADGDEWIVDLKISVNGLPGPIRGVFWDVWLYAFLHQTRIRTGSDTWKNLGRRKDFWYEVLAPPIPPDGHFLEFQYRLPASWAALNSPVLYSLDLLQVEIHGAGKTYSHYSFGADYWIVFSND